MWEGSSWLAGCKRGSSAGKGGKAEDSSLAPPSMQHEILERQNKEGRCTRSRSNRKKGQL